MTLEIVDNNVAFGSPPPPEPGPEPEAAEIVVTAPRLFETGGGGGSLGSYGPGISWSSLRFTPAPTPFEEWQGQSAPDYATFAQVKGNIVVRLPGYTFELKLPAAEWSRMSSDQKGAFLKVMNEFHQSPKFVEALNHLEINSVSQILINYGSTGEEYDGSVYRFLADQFGYVAYAVSANDDGSGTDIAAGTKVVISINSRLVNSGYEFAKTLMHEIRHPVVPGKDGDDEWTLRNDESTMYSDIFNTRNEIERNSSDYLNGFTFFGSTGDDTASGGEAGDALTGGLGNDTLDGGGGDDLVAGGLGRDWLSGGTGTNSLSGGADADVYAPAPGATLDFISETAGVDRIDLSRVSIDDVVFSRFGDDLQIEVFSFGNERVVVERQWLAASKVEQFTFAEGTYAASYVEYLADTTGGTGVCYDGGQPVICGSFGLPVVLDLDGDGIELVDAGRSRALFDIDGDGQRERIGWVGRDDGILALDRNGNGRIDDFREISFLNDFKGAGTDLEGLYAYDTDGDGWLTAADDRFGDFLVWRDKNGNGRSDKNELFTLDDLGITGIDLERRDIQLLDVDNPMNQTLATSRYRTSDGRDHVLGDVALYSPELDEVVGGAQAVGRPEPWMMHEMLL